MRAQIAGGYTRTATMMANAHDPKNTSLFSAMKPKPKHNRGKLSDNDHDFRH